MTDPITEAQREAMRAGARRSWENLTPEQRAARNAATLPATFRRSIDAALRKIEARRAYLSDEQRQRLMDLARAPGRSGE